MQHMHFSHTLYAHSYPPTYTAVFHRNAIVAFIGDSNGSFILYGLMRFTVRRSLTWGRWQHRESRRAVPRVCRSVRSETVRESSARAQRCRARSEEIISICSGPSTYSKWPRTQKPPAREAFVRDPRAARAARKCLPCAPPLYAQYFQYCFLSPHRSRGH